MSTFFKSAVAFSVFLFGFGALAAGNEEHPKQERGWPQGFVLPELTLSCTDFSGTISGSPLSKITLHFAEENGTGEAMYSNISTEKGPIDFVSQRIRIPDVKVPPFIQVALIPRRDYEESLKAQDWENMPVRDSEKIFFVDCQLLAN